MAHTHTEGPWTFFDDGYICAPDGCVIADLLGSEVGEDDANARLIAAAPDMLAALRAMVEQFGTAEDADWPDAYDRFALSTARAAISKAEGRNDGGTK